MRAVSSAGLILTGDTLFGTASQGGGAFNATVFALNTNGGGFTNLHNFTNSSDGWLVSAGLTLSGSTLYGAAFYGGSDGGGALFSVSTNSLGFTNVYDFSRPSSPNPLTNSDGAHPIAAVVVAANTVYGTAQEGGAPGEGTLYAVNADGTNFRLLHTFVGGASDGAYPNSLLLSGSMLFGTTSFAGSAGHGTVFAASTNGATFTNLFNFTSTQDAPQCLILSGDTIYGTTLNGGSSFNGAVFAVKTNGTGLTNIHSFPKLDNDSSNGEGVHPNGGLIMAGIHLIRHHACGVVTSAAARYAPGQYRRNCLYEPP